LPDLEVETIKIHITMKKEQNLQEPQKQALNIPVVSTSFIVFHIVNGEYEQLSVPFRTIDEATGYKSRVFTANKTVIMAVVG
jgi:DNA helicase IV